MKTFLLILLTTLISWTALATNNLTPKFAYKTKGLTATFINKTEGQYKDLEWNFGDGETSSETNPTHTYDEKGMYTFTLTITTKDNEKIDFEGKIYVFNTSKKKKVKADIDTKIKETTENPAALAKTVIPATPVTENLSNVKAFPNPFETTTTIDFALNQNQKVSVQLFDLSGQLVKDIQNEPLQTGTHQVSIERDQLPAGTYLLKMTTTNQVKTLKLVIQ